MTEPRITTTRERRLRRLLNMALPLCFVCPTCGPLVSADEDGCCTMCGADCSVRKTRYVRLKL